jgi:uncharacterized membrane protein YphA (DoxX/SURF4 family)
MKTFILFLLRIIPAFLMLQTLYFKFSGSEESIYIFSALGVEPWGRIITGCMELLAGILLLVPRTVIYGALLGIGIMAGAVMSHLTVLGIEVMDDGGQLFLYAILTMSCCAVLAWIYKNDLPLLIRKNKK